MARTEKATDYTVEIPWNQAEEPSADIKNSEEESAEDIDKVVARLPKVTVDR